MEMITTLSSKYYTCADYFKKEAEFFFFEQWNYVGRVEELPKKGDFIQRTLLGENIILVRGNDERIRGFYNLCRHRGTILCEESKGNLPKSIQCPYHAWTWSLEGKLVGAPHMNETEGFCLENYPLNPVQVEEWEGHLFMNFSMKAKSLEECLGRMKALFAPWKMSELTVEKRIHYDVKANWKLIIQNYSECLHCPIIHPALAKISPYLSGKNEDPCPQYFGGSMKLNEGVETMSMDGKSHAMIIPGLSDENRRHVYYYAILPNLLLSAHPDYVMTHRLIPKSEKETEIICEFLFHPESKKRGNFSTKEVSDFWDLTNVQDWKVSELSQIGLGSRGYLPGPYSHRESLLAYMDKVSRDTVEGGLF